MRVGIDARLFDETGVGRYIGNLIYELGKLDKQNHYVVFLRKKSFDSFKLPNTHWEKRLADIPWHSFREQIFMPGIFLKENLYLVHIPYFNVPVFYPGKFIVTIHDLTILHFDTGKASTLPFLFYKLRRIGYFFALTAGLARASKIIAVSQATKHEIVAHFHINPEKIIVTHEGINRKVLSSQFSVLSKKKIIEDAYFLYVGNAYPHKNLEMLLKAFQKFSVHSSQFTVKLVLVGKDDYFYKQLRLTVEDMQLSDKVIFFGRASEDQLQNLYKNATALVFPSLMEGFGLPGLEAMAVGTPVVCSDIPVFHEIYGDSALYFDPKSQEDLTKKINQVGNEEVRKKLIQKGLVQVKKYSWEKMARNTKQIYRAQ